MGTGKLARDRGPRFSAPPGDEELSRNVYVGVGIIGDEVWVVSCEVALDSIGELVVIVALSSVSAHIGDEGLFGTGLVFLREDIVFRGAGESSVSLRFVLPPVWERVRGRLGRDTSVGVSSNMGVFGELSFAWSDA
jgi:hypothetical protein